MTYLHTLQLELGQTRAYYQIDPSGYSWGFVMTFTSNDRGSKYILFYLLYWPDSSAYRSQLPLSAISACSIPQSDWL